MVSFVRRYEFVEELYDLCRMNGYFYRGTNYQYERLFELAKRSDTTVEELAAVIYVCSDDCDLSTIIKQISDLVAEMNRRDDIALGLVVESDLSTISEYERS